MEKNSKFRQWVREIFYQYKDEVERFKLEQKTDKEYFSTYKWWLKSKYKKERE